jgi:hypothetical protein
MFPTIPFFILAKAQRGDPNPIGWLTTFAYFCVAGFCFWAGRREKEQAIGRARIRHAPLFWFTLCGVMVALGFNKQLDIQSDITQIGRDMAVSEGWYENRRIVQLIFVTFFGIAAVGAVVAGFWFMRDLWHRYRMAFVGIIYLCTFVIIRAASFHHIDNLLYHLPGAGYWVNTFLELGGNVILGTAAYRAAVEEQQTRYQAYETRVKTR